jgi:hypothetical protein
VFETNFGLVQTPDRTKANMRAYKWHQMKDWLLHGAIEADEKMAARPGGTGISHQPEQPAGAGIHFPPEAPRRIHRSAAQKTGNGLTVRQL